jgi:hypothetical protein
LTGTATPGTFIHVSCCHSQWMLCPYLCYICCINLPRAKASLVHFCNMDGNQLLQH